MIQDRFREELLLKKVPDFDREKTIYYPVAISGPKIDTQNKRDPIVVLYYGGLWSTKLVDALENAAANLNDDFRVVVKGGRGNGLIQPRHHGNFLVDISPIPFGELDETIGKADIGIALYHAPNNNSRTTAFSSEKIARYTRFGIPFIAFDNPDYQYLKSIHDCCVLIDEYSELSQAIESLAEKYDYFRQNAFAAFDEFYDLEKSSRHLLERMNNQGHGSIRSQDDCAELPRT